jgi:hypothetical protein
MPVNGQLYSHTVINRAGNLKTENTLKLHSVCNKHCEKQSTVLNVSVGKANTQQGDYISHILAYFCF